MKQSTDVLGLLQCPCCTSDLSYSSVLRRDRSDRVEYGLLRCSGCRQEYPIIAGIPILLPPHETLGSRAETTKNTLIEGDHVSNLVWLLKAKQPIRALSLLLNPAGLDEDWLFSLDFRQGDGRSQSAALTKTAFDPVRFLPRKAKNRLRRVVLPSVRLRLAKFLTADGDKLTALQAMDLIYRRYSRVEHFNDFAYQFGRPRHLAALSLASLLGDSQAPILDLACGVGHLTHFFSFGRPERAVVGVDRDFVRLWVARHYVAPDAHFVCGPADRALPFRSRSFVGVFCSDAFHYFLWKSTSVQEMRRVVTPQGTIVLARAGNAALAPHEGYELDVDGYARLFPQMHTTILGERELVAAYLARRGPDLDVRAPALESEKWLSLVASEKRDVFGRGVTFVDWPHAIGALRLNPIFAVGGPELDGALDLRFRFPSESFRIENEAYLQYAPQTYLVPQAAATAIARGQRPDTIEDMLNKFVLIGVPNRYC
jgi:ubiquinone/menaquinone biosynthesis C-methylase UbiE/uncharacterized protein YbaR (Trm112 family)